MLFNCPLCHSNSTDYYSQEFKKCSLCESIFRIPKYFLSPEQEKARYEHHNNDVTDINYQNFVHPIVSQVLKNHTPKEVWLDFWAGTGPVISHLLEIEWFSIHLYDPFFHNSPELLNKKYDFIIACEVIEHFHKPRSEFQRLYDLLVPWGELYIMTDIYDEETNFWNWYYKNDPTHVCFYTEKSFLWIQEHWKWKRCSREWRCITFEK